MTDEKQPNILFGLQHRTYWTGGLLLFALWFGYQLAETNTKTLTSKIATLQQTNEQLIAENKGLVQAAGRIRAKQSVCASELNAAKVALGDQELEAQKCLEQVGFYRFVMAPEKIQNGLFVDMIEARHDIGDRNEIYIDFVLLQPDKTNAAVAGALNIGVVVEGYESSIPLATLDYRFRYFQEMRGTYVLPNGAVPKALLFESNVMQGKKSKGQFYQKIEWPQNADENL